MPQETAIGKILTFCSKVELFRAQQLAYASKDGFERTYSVNVTALEAGSQVNIIPEVASCLVDVRTPPHISIEKTKVLLKLFAKDANVEIEELYAGPDIEAESPHIENFKSKIYSAIENDLGISVEKDLIFLGSTGKKEETLRQFCSMHRLSLFKKIWHTMLWNHSISTHRASTACRQ